MNGCFLLREKIGGLWVAGIFENTGNALPVANHVERRRFAVIQAHMMYY
jgi:hypothetical protein